MKLSKSRVENLPIPESGQAFFWDEELRGFGVRVTPSGARSYIVQGRVNGKSRRVTLGPHGRLTCDQARKQARLALLDLDAGKDPNAEKKRQEAEAATLRDVADAYIRDRRDLKPSSVADIRKHIGKGLSDWADRPVAAITRDAVAVRFRELSERSPAQANQCMRILRALMNYARAAYRTPEGTPTLPENPVGILSEAKLWNRVQAKSRRIPTDRVGSVWNMLMEMRVDPGKTTVEQTAADITIFLMLTGARWSEAAELTWNRVDLGAKSWHLPDPKSRRPVTFPLAAPVCAMLASRGPGDGFVFPGRSNGHIADARGALNRVSDIAGTRISAHDLRRTFRAVAGECGIELWKTKLLMNHKLSGDVTITHYTETADLRYLAPDAEKIAAWIIEQGAIAAGANVARLRARR